MSKKKAIEEQVTLQSEMQRHGLNLIECGGCNAVLFHRRRLNTSIVVCPHCEKKNYTDECADVYYEGMETQTQFRN
jgi:hypothetical protein